MNIRYLMAQQYFSLGILQNYLIFLSTKNIFDFLPTHFKFIHGNLKDFLKKVLKI